MDTVGLKEVIGKMCRLSAAQGRDEEYAEATGVYLPTDLEREKEMMALWRKIDAIIEEGQL